MLGNPVDPPLLAREGSDNARGAENQQERLGAYERPENPQRPYAGPLPPTRERMRWSDTRGDAGSWNRAPALVRLKTDKTVSSEIPCRVSSDLHEWRNDLG